MRYLTLFLALVFGSMLKGQDSTQLVNEILALARPYQEAESWHIQQEIVMLDQNTGELLDREKTETYKSGNRQYSKQFSEEILMDAPYLVKVDKQEKEIVVESYQTDQLPDFPLEEYFELYRQIEYRETEKHKIYYLQLKEYYIYKELEIWVDKAKGQLQKLCVYPKYPMEIKGMERTVKLEINYSTIEFNPRGIEKKLSIDRYFNLSGGELKLNPPYQNYTLINRINL